eukprot:m.791413 g.791413  ORF g.791413 m.791413 type:complete len:85 (-) comp23330_c1_seq25:925-1179(-)
MCYVEWFDPIEIEKGICSITALQRNYLHVEYVASSNDIVMSLYRHGGGGCDRVADEEWGGIPTRVVDRAHTNWYCGEQYITDSS